MNNMLLTRNIFKILTVVFEDGYDFPKRSTTGYSSPGCAFPPSFGLVGAPSYKPPLGLKSEVFTNMALSLCGMKRSV